MLAGFESTGCYRRHLNFAAGGRAEAVPGYTGVVRQWTGVRVTALTLAILVGGLPDTAATPARQARVALVGGTIYPSPTEPPILAALTTTPAAIFGGAAATGRIAPGQPADLVVLDGDPSRNVRALADVRYTLRDGVVVYFRDQFRDDTSERARRSRVGARLPR